MLHQRPEAVSTTFINEDESKRTESETEAHRKFPLRKWRMPIHES